MKKINNKQKFEYLFRITLEDGPSRIKGQKPYREISLLTSQTLSTLARVIVNSFGFYFDHPFGFYDNLDNTFESENIFELFTDLPEVEHTKGAFGVTYVKISRAFDRVGKKMKFLFDYGDGWQFITELLEIKPANRSRKNPRVIKKVGIAPEQYPEYGQEMDAEEYLENLK